jgi:hypothetical protein
LLWDCTSDLAKNKNHELYLLFTNAKQQLTYARQQFTNARQNIPMQGNNL